MGQLYLQQFRYRDGVGKAEIDKAWADGFATFARSGNWGGVDSGVKHHQTYGTGWGGYALIEVEDPEAFGRYQAHHNQNYGYAVNVTWEPLYDLDRMAEGAVRDAR
jgi:hypothetical protein